MKTIIRETQYKNNQAYIIENDQISAEMVPSIGGKLVSIYYKSTGKEWLLDSGQRDLNPIDPATKFTAADMSGWDECFPSVKPCTVGDRDIADHGDLWHLPWNVVVEEEVIVSSIINEQLNYRFSRSMELHNNQLVLSYEVFNMSEQLIPFIWIPHPQFCLTEPTQIVLPPSISELLCVYNSDPQNVNQSFSIPRKWVIDPESNQTGEKYYTENPVVDALSGLYGLKSKSYLKLKSDAKKVSFLGVWIDRGLFNDRSTIALEPSIGYYDLLTRAIENGTAAYIEPQKSYKWQLEIELGHTK